KTNSRVYGYYSWASPVTSNVGLRTKCHWHMDDASTLACGFTIEMPGEVSAFLGLHNEDPGITGMSAKFSNKPNRVTNTPYIEQGLGVPFVSLMFKPFSGGRIGQEFSTESTTYSVTDQRGTFIDQRDLFPAVIKENCPNDN